jgi:transcriptional regulator with XRE-family HTH domain
MQLMVWRKQRGWSLAVCAEHFQLSHTQVMRIERGLSKPSTDAAKRIEAATNGEVTAAELLGLESKPQRSVREDQARFERATVAVEVHPFLLEDAKTYGIDAAAVIARGGVDALRDALKAAWTEANHEALKANEDYIREHGSFTERAGVFSRR